MTTPNLFLMLLNPAIATIFGTVVLVVALAIRARRHFLLFPLGTYAFATAIALQSFYWSPEDNRNTVITGVMYLASVVCTGEVFVRHYSRRNNYWLLAAIVVVVLSLVYYHTHVDVDLRVRIYALNFGAGGILVLSALRIRDVRRGRLVDRLIFWSLLVTGLHFFPRTVVSLLIDDHAAVVPHFRESTYWASINFSYILSVLAVTMMTLACIVSDFFEAARNDGLRDPLSGLFNRRGFEEKAPRPGDGLRSLVFCDLDHFKRINDSLGHAVGDSVLSEMGPLVARCLGPDDIAARIGGEEFVILLPGQGGPASEIFAERLRREIQAHAFVDLPPSWRITASFGIAVALPGESLGGLMKRADTMLYAAKEGGRNQVRMYRPSLPVPAKGEI